MGENMQIKKRKNGTYYVRYIKKEKKTGGFIYGYLEGKTKNQILKEIEKAKKYLPYDVFYLNRKDTFFEMVSLFLTAQKIKVKPSTYSTYFYTIKKYILPFFADLKKEEIKEAYVLQFTNTLFSKNLSPKRIKDILVLLKQIFLFSKLDCSVIFPRVPKKDILVFTKEEQERLEVYLKDHLNLETLGILICLYTGVRIGEICALKWDDIDLEKHKIKITHTIVRVVDLSKGEKKTKILLDTPKTTHSKREIPLPTFLGSYLKLFQNKADFFLLTGNENPMDSRNFFKQILKENSLEFYNFHALRHTFATRCIELGFDAKTVSELLGHANVKITLDLYVHPSMDTKRKLMNRLSSSVFKG